MVKKNEPEIFATSGVISGINNLPKINVLKISYRKNAKL